MSQNDLSIANQGFASFRSDLNSALQALGSTNSGTSAPSTTYANQLFYDTSNNILKIRNEDNDAFISLFTLDQANDNIESLTINGALSCEGFTSNGIDDNADAVAITIDSSENVLVGTTASTDPATNNVANGVRIAKSNGRISASADGTQALNLNRKTDDGDIAIFRKNGTIVGTIGNSGGAMYISASSTGGLKYTFLDGSSAVTQPCNTSGTVTDGTHDLGSSGARFRNLYLGGGLYVGGTGSANYLDDYEEGTFTLAVSSGFTLDATFSQSYRKIGDIVHVFISFQADVTNGTECVLTGLPFNCAVGNEPVLVVFNDGSTNDYIPRGRTNVSQPQFKFNPKNTASNIQIIIQGTYRVSS